MSEKKDNLLSIVMPAKNEGEGLTRILPQIREKYPDAEIIVVNDGSTDDTVEVCRRNNVILLTHPYSMGNGAAIKTGARHATGNVLVLMDADGQHDPADIPRLLEKLSEGYDMVVGARSHPSQAGLHRAIGNNFYNKIASWMVKHKIEDLTSGFRAVRAKKFRRFLYLLPNGFSYPTTITMAFFRSAYPIAYIPIIAGKRRGMSNIQLVRDGFRFFIIILKIGSLFSPMRLFLPVSFFFFLIGILYYSYTYLYFNRLTIMSALLFIASMLTFLIGIVSEQVSALHYKNADWDRESRDGDDRPQP